MRFEVDHDAADYAKDNVMVKWEKTMGKLYSAACRLAPELVGRLEHKVRRGAGMLPMNGQAARLEIAREIFELCAINRVIETGAYRGATTDWLSQFGKPVTTIEINPVLAAYCRARLRPRANVQVRNMNSVEGLQALVGELDDRTEPTFFYLDAHWYDYLPLRGELEVVFANFTQAVVMIDDFQVPDDPDYYYDDYGSGGVLTLTYLREAALPPMNYFFPTVKGRWETGGRRGSIVMTANSSMFDRLCNAPLLRTWSINGE
jgi:hypothetical protein